MELFEERMGLLSSLNRKGRVSPALKAATLVTHGLTMADKDNTHGIFCFKHLLNILCETGHSKGEMVFLL